MLNAGEKRISDILVFRNGDAVSRFPHVAWSKDVRCNVCRSKQAGGVVEIFMNTVLDGELL